LDTDIDMNMDKELDINIRENIAGHPKRASISS
jgi:hypothetical protein